MDGRSSRWSAGRSVAVVLGFLGVWGGGVPTEAEAAIPVEIPIVSRLGVGARPLGMGGAYSAVADDYHALYYNPAALVRVKRMEFGAALANRSTESNTRYFDNHESTPLDKTSLQSLGFAYPYPTYRGSLAIALSYEKVSLFDSDYFRKGEGGGITLEEETITEDAGLGAYQAGFAWELSPRVALGVTGTILAGSSSRYRLFEYDTSGADRERTETATEMDLTAITGTIGILYSVNPRARFSLVLNLPESYDLEGTIEDDVIRYEEAPGDTLDYIDTFSFDDEMTLPLRVTVGGAYELSSFTLAGDFTFADWKEIDYYGPIRNDLDRDFAYRSTVDIRLGVEYAIPRQPVRLRAGFISQPVPYDLVGVDVFHGIAERATFERDNRYFTLGAGIELDEALTVDVAYLTGGYERSGRSFETTTVEEIDESRLLVGATFRIAN